MKNFTHSSQIQKVSIPLQTYHSTNLILGLITNVIVMQGKGREGKLPSYSAL